MKFCAANNAFYMRDLSVDLLETFKTNGFPEEMADTSKATAVAKLRCFLRTAYRRDWINESLVDKVISYRAVYEQKEPYSDEEVKKILDGALELNGGTHAYAKHPKSFGCGYFGTTAKCPEIQQVRINRLSFGCRLDRGYRNNPCF